ncbi:hypothetical protein EB796_009672 [Bugula neritina]|uniref:Uncharacterized protein n=1 Tax=Bugula neritina TaxID=10212 RepID=A0A7J7K364_BUGNE|nr:hypothetical protein EB796_009672 [Bugula neritina]
MQGFGSLGDMFSHLDNIPVLNGYYILLLNDKCISSFQFSFQFAIDALHICHGKQKDMEIKKETQAIHLIGLVKPTQNPHFKSLFLLLQQNKEHH